MSETAITFRFLVDDVLTDATSVVFSDPTDTFGLRRTDTLATVVANATALDHDGTGLYSYTVTDPAGGLTYNYWLEVVYDGATYHFERDKSGETGAASPGSLRNTLVSGLMTVLPEVTTS
jgi:hypothetical protein